MKIACLTSYDTQNPESWPKRHLGSYKASQKVMQGIDLPLDYLISPRVEYPSRTKLAYFFYKNCFKQKYYNWSQRPLNTYTIEEYDYIVCPENYTVLSNLRTSVPTILWTDTTIGTLIDFYPYLQNISYSTRQGILENEGRVLNNCHRLVVTNEWSKQKSIELYDLNPNKVFVVPRPMIRRKIERNLVPGEFNLTLVTLDWERKNGDLAIQIVEKLYQLGLNVKLNLVGLIPDRVYPSYINNLGFLNEKDISSLYQKTNLLLSCSGSDVAGTNILEAQSFGCPALCKLTGGVGEYCDMHYNTVEEAVEKTFNYVLEENKSPAKTPFYIDEIKNKFKEIIK